MPIRAKVASRFAIVLAVSGLTLASAAYQDAPKAMSRGDKATLHAVYGWIPYFKNEAAFKQYLTVVKASNDRSAAVIRGAFLKSLWLLKDGTEVEIVDAEPVVEPDPGKPKAKSVPLAKALSVLQVPHIVVKKPGSDTPLFVPAIYVRPDGSKPYPVEAKFLVLAPFMDRRAIPAPGREMFLYNSSDETISAAADDRVFDDMAKAILATDEIGLDALVKAKQVARIPSGTKALIIERHENAYFERRITAAELRFIDGPCKGQTAWVMEDDTAIPAIEVMTPQAAARLVNPPAKKKR